MSVTNEEVICLKVAAYFANRNWHELSPEEREIVSDLSIAGWLTAWTQGFTGTPATPTTELQGD